MMTNLGEKTISKLFVLMMKNVEQKKNICEIFASKKKFSESMLVRNHTGATTSSQIGRNVSTAHNLLMI